LMIWGTHALDNQQTFAALHKTAQLTNPAHVARKVEFIQGTALTAHIEQPESVVTAIQHWQEEIDRGTLLAPEERPIFALHTANQQSTPPAVLVEPASTATPLAEHTRSAERATDAAQSDEAVTAQSAALTGQDSAPTLSNVNEVQGTLEATPLQPVEVAAEVPTPLARNKAEEAVETAAPEARQKEEREIIAYCVKCKQKRKMLKAREVVMKNGRPAMRGVCSVCGTRLNRIGGIS